MNVSPSHLDSQLTDKERATLEILHDQIRHCQEDIASYNSQFLSSSVLCAVLAAFAGVVCSSPSESQILRLFYVLPSVYFLELYNVIKYTGMQLKLGAYRQVLEDEVNRYLGKNYLCWEATITQGPEFLITGGAVQLFFDIPLSLFLLAGFWRLPHDTLWWVLVVFLIAQMITIVYMALSLITVKEHTLKEFQRRLER